jgi:hypothetical protein
MHRRALGSCIAAFLFSAGCASSHRVEPDGSTDATLDGGPDLPTPADQLGRCEPTDQEECGCIQGFRRCDTCDSCPFGFGCSAEAYVCRARDVPDDIDGCNFRIDTAIDGEWGPPGGSYARAASFVR